MAALIALTGNLLEFLNDNQYIQLIALDFNKAFDTVRHSYIAEQLAVTYSRLYNNWIIACLDNCKQGTKFNRLVSATTSINASIVQGPLNFITAISKLKAVHPTNRLIKYADDTYCTCWYQHYGSG